MGEQIEERLRAVEVKVAKLEGQAVWIRLIVVAFGIGYLSERILSGV